MILFIPRLILTVIYRIAVFMGVAMALIAAVCSVANRYLEGK